MMTALAAPSSARRGQASWALYDWANSPFPTLVITFLFGPYFQQAVVGDPVAGQAMWGMTLALSGLAVALLAPFLGAVADAGGARKPWLLVLTLIGAAATALLWFVAPDPAFVPLALVLVAISSVAIDFSEMLVNALLPDVAGPREIGRLSGRAWALGYAGGLLALVLVLALLVQPQVPPFGLDPRAAEQVRLVGPFVAAWLLLFSLPLFLFTPDRPRRGRGVGNTLAAGLAAMARMLKTLPSRPGLVRFLLANMLYSNGLLTLFALGGVYAAGLFGMSLRQVLAFGIALNVAAGLGAFASSFLDDRIGSRRTVLIALLGLIVAGTFAVLAREAPEFWFAGLAIGIFAGPVQSASRSMMARMAPGESAAGHFGLYALSGRVTAFLGPAVAAAVTSLSGSQRYGMATIILFLAAGFGLLLLVREPSTALARSTAAAGTDS